MARRQKKWVNQYKKELSNAKQRAKTLAKRGVGYDFPKTAPRNAREAQRRIKEFQQLRVSAIANRSLPKGAYGVSTFENPYTGTSTYKYSTREVYRLQLLEEQANRQRRRYGLQTSNYTQNRAFQSERAYRQYVQGLRKQGSSSYQSARQRQYVENYIQGLESAIDILNDSDDVKSIRRIIKRIEDIGVAQASRMLLDAEAMGVSIHTIVFGSDQDIIRANIGLIERFWFGRKEA